MNTEIIDKIKCQLLEKKKKEKESLRNDWEQMKPFQTIDDIPSIPILENKEMYENIIVKNLIRCGAISKEQLEIGIKYEGKCRNATVAIWNGENFDYKRYKFGMWFDDKINHFQDDNGYDLFVPLKKIENNK